MVRVNLRSLAYKNVWRNRGRYLAYLVSAAFSVMVYFLYSALALHPELQGGFRGAAYARVAVEAASVVIALFTFLFLMYSSAAFARFRMKEFGLLSLLGLTRRQMVRLILWENLVVALSALAIGLSVGLLFVKLFFMAVSALLGLTQELTFIVGGAVWYRTIVVFGSFFLIVSFVSLRSVLRRSIIELIRSRRKPKDAPVFSRWKTLLGLALVGVGYAWACVPHPVAVLLGVVPVTTLVSVGTYLLMREGATALLTRLRRRERFFFRPRPFLIVSQSLFKMQENHRSMTAVALLVAVILSAVGTIYAVYAQLGERSIAEAPHALQLVLPSNVESETEIALVQKRLATHDVRGLRHVRTALIQGGLGETDVYVLPYSMYAQAHWAQGSQAPVKLEAGDQAILVHPMVLAQRVRPEAAPRRQTLRTSHAEMDVSVVSDYSGRLLNGEPGERATLVLSDQRFAQLLGLTPRSERWSVAVWSGPTWRGDAIERVIAALDTRYVAERAGWFTNSLAHYHGSMREVGLTLFIGIFVSLVFFAATCSLLYFRLFTEIDEDRMYYRKLNELGLGRQEIYRLARLQSAVLFVVPFAVGLVHSTFAMNALGALVMRTVLHLGWMVALGYLVIYLLYFGATYGLYWRTMAANVRSGLV